MAEKVLQCCYTNATRNIGGTVSSGWQAVAESENIPDQARTRCVNYQQANSSIQKAMFDERGNVLNLLEINGDGTYVYIMRTKYGSTDRLGRANMFSHAFIYSWKDEGVLTDPNFLLTIENDNYKENEEDASQIPAELHRGAPMDIRSAMAVSGLDIKRYQTLIRCVYAQMSERSIMEPLFIQYDGSEEEMRAILYCIYYALPFYLRRKLCIASNTAIDDEHMNIVFSQKADTKEYYCDPATGENNVLSNRIKYKIGRYGYIDHVVNCLGTGEPVNPVDYYVTLEENAAELGDPTGANELVLKIAYQLMNRPEIQDYSQEDLEEILADALRSGAVSDYMNQQMTLMMEAINQQHLLMSDEIDSYLDEQFEATTSDTLRNAIEQYYIYRLSTLTPEDAAKRLSVMKAETFGTYSKVLQRSAEGQQILDLYYATYRLPDDATWSVLEQIWDESAYVIARPVTIARIDALAQAHYREALQTQGTVSAAYDSYTAILRKVFAEDEAAVTQRCNVAKVEYWATIKYTNYSLVNAPEYAYMADGSDQSNMMQDYTAFMHGLHGKTMDAILPMVQAYYQSYQQNITPEDLKMFWQQMKTVLQSDEATKGKAIRIVNWSMVAYRLTEPEQVDTILELSHDLYDERYDDLVDLFRAVPDKTWYDSDKNRKWIAQLIVQYCKKNDRGDHMVPLDVWLLTGAELYPNAFMALDVSEQDPLPCVLDADPITVAAKSQLLFERSYQDAAEDYIANRGVEAKTVKRWLSEVRKIEKEERRANGEDTGLGSVIGGLFGRGKNEAEDYAQEAEPRSRKGRFPFSKH